MQKLRTMRGLAGLVLATGCTAALAATADDSDWTDTLAKHVDGYLIGTFQSTTQDHVDGSKVHPEGNGQLYLFGHLPVGPGTLNLEVRAGTTPRRNGVTSYYGEVNDSVGETLDSDGDGRVAATQFYYDWNTPFGGTLDAGLIDPTAMLDTNPIADNEYTQFLGSSFVNDPTIEYPSPALGLHYQAGAEHGLGMQLFISSSSGIQDPDRPSYRNVFDLGGTGKGVFSAAELTWRTEPVYGDIGVWYNSAHHAHLARPLDTRRADNVGAYATVGGRLAGGQWVGWAGVADAAVSEAANFVGAAYSHPAGRITLGAGLAHIGASSHIVGPADDIEQAEVYARIPVAPHLHISPDLQYVNHSDFNPQLDHVVVTGVRVGASF